MTSLFCQISRTSTRRAGIHTTQSYLKTTFRDVLAATTTGPDDGTCTKSRKITLKETVIEQGVKEAKIVDHESGKLDVVNSDDELQPQWRALEHRVNQRKSKIISEGTPRGRSPRRPGAWDHECV